MIIAVLLLNVLAGPSRPLRMPSGSVSTLDPCLLAHKGSEFGCPLRGRRYGPDDDASSLGWPDP